MISAETVDPGRLSGGRSNFSLIYTLLSQYVKEKGSFGDLKLGLNRSPETKGSNADTMNLFPMIEKSVPGSGNLLNVPSTIIPQKPDLSAQMTIFYAGQVLVFDSIPADKANDIMNLASTVQNAAFPLLHAGTHRSAQPPFDSDLPIARKNSLSRFLEKRRDRVTPSAPYPATKPAKPSTGEAWLILAPEISLQIQRH